MKSNYKNQPYYTFLSSVPPFRDIMGHDGIKALLHELGDFHLHLKVIHLAGTNGKGSSAKMLSSIYHSSGLKTGTFTSPYINDYRECISIDEKMIDIPFMNFVVLKVEKAYQSLINKYFPLPTHYECITVCALLAMYLEKIDICIIETLMGGLNDATNIIDHPLISLITSISYDHTEYLGTSLREIATHKAGIIKANRPVVVNKQSDEAFKVLFDTANRLNSPFYSSQKYATTLYKEELSSFYKSMKLKGCHQKDNLYGVLSVIHLLQNKFPVDNETVLNGLTTVNHPCRIETITLKELPFIFDGAHNLEGITALVNYIKTEYPDYKTTFILGMLNDKEHFKIAELIFPLAHQVILSKPKSPRTFEPKEFYDKLEKDFQRKVVFSKSREELADELLSVSKEKQTAKTLFVVCGSLYLCTPVKELLLERLNESSSNP